MPSGSTPTLAPSKRRKAAAATADSGNTSSPPKQPERFEAATTADSGNTSSPPPQPEHLDQHTSPSSPSSQSDCSSDSDYSIIISKATKIMSSTSSSIVSAPTVEHHSLHHAPILTAGVPTPAILLEFEDACENFFANAKGGIADDVKVKRILPGFKDPIMRRWISSDRAHLSTLKFDEFMTLLCSKFLSKQWEDELLSKILRDHLRQGQDFLTWATKLQQQNCILRNTESQLDKKRLHEQISIAVDIDLCIAAREAKVNNATTLREFLDIYQLCDEKRRLAKNHTRSIIDESNRKNKTSNKENAYHPYKKDGRNTSSSQNSTTSSTRPPKLTQIEIEIIKTCSGCFKCRKIFQSKDHINTDPTKKACEFPSGDNYKPLTWDYANKIKALREARKTSSSKAIASTSSAPPSSSSSTPSTSSISEVNSSDESNLLPRCLDHSHHRRSLETTVSQLRGILRYVNRLNLNTMFGNA